MAKPNGEVLTGLRVLVAEDELVIAMLLEDMLAELNVEVVGLVRSAKELLHTIEASRPDLATLDINLRGEQVFAAAVELRVREIPFIFISGYGEGEMSGWPKDFWDTPFLKKPFRLEELAAILKSTMVRANAK